MTQKLSYYSETVDLLKEEGVNIEDLADIVLELQSKYDSGLTMDMCIDSVKKVLEKREVQNAIFTGVELDRAARNGTLKNPILLDALNNDAGLYGLDEAVAFSICNIYGTIALTNYGYIDKMKLGIVGEIDAREECNVFLDDLAGAIAAAAIARLAHRQRREGLK